MKDIFKELGLRKVYLENKGYEVLCIGLYGSQNYNMQDEDSDIDVRAIVMPTLTQIVTREKISKKYVLDNGDIDVKDLFTYYEVVRKGNFSFIEPMQTDYFIGDKYIKQLFSNITLNFKSVKGAMHEKAKAFRHHYPSKMVEINKWGFDPKQLHHIFRLLDLLQNYNSEDNKSFIYYDIVERRDDKILFDTREHLFNTKRNLHDCITRRNYTDDDIKLFVEEANTYIPTDYKYVPVDLSFEINEYMISKLKCKLNNTNISSVRQYRTFGGNIPKQDLKRFSELEKYVGKDISYNVYENVDDIIIIDL